MIGWHSQIRVYAYCAPVNMRMGFERLAGLVRNELGRDPLSGELFLFTNRRRTHVKVLFFDGSGTCIFAKKIERSRFGALWDYSRGKEMMLTKSELEAQPGRRSGRRCDRVSARRGAPPSLRPTAEEGRVKPSNGVVARHRETSDTDKDEPHGSPRQSSTLPRTYH